MNFGNSIIRASSIVAMLITLTACSKTVSVSGYSPPLSTSSEEMVNYKIGEIQEAFIGEKIIESGKFIYVSEGSATYKAVATLDGFRKCMTVGGIHSVLYQDNGDGNLYVTSCPNTTSRFTGTKITPDGKLADKQMYFQHNMVGWTNNVLTNIGVVGTKLFEPIELERTLDKGSFKYELIYGGLHDNNIKVEYREYKDDIARPAFYQNVTYDLTKSTVVRYKKFKIKVHSADNEKITYTVLSDS